MDLPKEIQKSLAKMIIKQEIPHYIGNSLARNPTLHKEAQLILAENKFYKNDLAENKNLCDLLKTKYRSEDIVQKMLNW